jgi:hypothetical protein
MRWATFAAGFAAGLASASLVAILVMARGADRSAPMSQPSVAGAGPATASPPPAPAPAQMGASSQPASAPASAARPPAQMAVPAPVPLPAAVQAQTGLPQVRLPAEHAEMVRPVHRDNRPLTLAEQHQAFSLEDRDPEWANRMEQALRAVADGVWPAPEFELSLVECRRTICGVFAFGNLPDSGTRWNAGLSKIGEDGWTAGPLSGVTTVMTERGDRTTIVTFIRRAPSPGR